MKLHFKVLFMACFLSLFITACDQNEAVGNEPTQKELLKKRLFTAAKTAANKGTTTPSTGDEDFADECIATFDCFGYVFPITLTNETVETVVNNEDELYDYYDSLNEEADPKITFPITIKFDDDTEQNIANDDELDNAYESCFGEEELCFTINFPITVIGEGETLNVNEMEVNSETELHAFIEETYTNDESAEITFKYPITLTLEDDSVVTVENDEEFDAIYGECYGFEDYDDFEEFDCFELKFPITAINSEGEITLNSYEDVDNYIENLDEDAGPEFIFPLDILYVDGTLATISALEDLETAFDDCFYDDYEDAICFDITYPINLIKNDETTNLITVSNDEEFDEFLDGLVDEDYFDITYPLTVILQDESNTVITSDEEFIDLVDSCDQEF